MAKLFRFLPAKQKALSDVFDRLNANFENHMPPFSPPPIQVYTEERKSEVFYAENTYIISDEHEDQQLSHIATELCGQLCNVAADQGFMKIERIRTNNPHIQPGHTEERIIVSARFVENKK